MSLLSFEKLRAWRHKRTAFRMLLLVATSGLALASLVLPVSLRPTAFPLRVGDVATQDILAPSTLTYESKVLTDQARLDAASRVSPVYLPADPAITRYQIERLRVAIEFISTVRLDSYAAHDQKLQDLAAMTDLDVTGELADSLLSLNEMRWQVVKQEATSVLEQTMRTTIREDRVNDARRSLPTLVSFSMSEDQASLVVDLVRPFVVANSQLSPEQTQAARDEAGRAVVPVNRTFAAGETILLRGQIVSPEKWEALQTYGLVKPGNTSRAVIGAAALVLVLAAFVFAYFYRRRVPPMDDLRSLTMIAMTFLVFLFSARYLIPNHTVIPYLFPLPAFGLTIAALYSVELGLVFSLIISVLATFGLPNNIDLTLFYIMSSMCGVLMLGHARRILSFFYAGLAIGSAGTAIILAYRLGDSITDWMGLLTLTGASFFNGVASSSLTLLYQFIFAQMLGLTTALQLMELSRPDHPLLQMVLRNAPGTYQHSLQVANLAEQAADKIGADSLLVRVGALYHDAGKAANPQFFIENQIPGQTNTHDDLDPAVSAATIIQHVRDGANLARKYRLPPRIRDFVTEHHGTLLARYQYTRAVEAAGNDPSKVDMDKFRYPGPSPRSRETALLMLADGVEARARAELPKGEDELRALIARVYDYYQKEGQLNDTRLTLRDMSLAAESFLTTLRNTYHPRIKYPELKPAAGQLEDQQPEDAAPEHGIEPNNSPENGMPELPSPEESGASSNPSPLLS